MQLRRLVIVYILFCTQLYCYSQETAIASVEAIFTSEMSSEEKSEAVEKFLQYTDSIAPNELANTFYSTFKWHWRQGNKVQAKKWLLKERKLRVSIKDTILLKRNLYNIGYVLRNQDMPDYAKALAYFDSLIPLSQSIEPRLGSVYREKGDIYDQLGDFQRALENYYKSERILKETNNLSRLIKTHINISATYARLSDSIYLEPFLKNKKKLDHLLEGVALSEEQQIMLLSNLGSMYGTTTNYKNALAPYEKALDMAIQLEQPKLVFSLLNNIGIIYTKQGSCAKADEFLERAKKLSPHIDVRERSLLLDNMADLYLNQNNFESALFHYQKAISLLIASNTEIDSQMLPSIEAIKESPYKRDVLNYLVDKSDGWLAYYNATGDKKLLIEAAKTFDMADQIIDLLYFESSEEPSKLFWRQQGASLYINAVTVCYELNDVEKAFYFMEKNKGLLLLENMSDVRAKQIAGIPAEVIDREYKALGQIKYEERALAKAQELKKSVGEIDTLRARVFTKKNYYRNFLDSLENQYPAYYRFKQQIDITTPSSVIEGLSNNECVVSYILGEEMGYVMMISHSGLVLKKIENTPKFDANIAKILEYSSLPFQTKEDATKYQATALNLYQQLFPFNELNGTSAFTKICVIPDVRLFKIPFEALSTSVHVPIQDSYLINDYEIYYKYSLSVATQLDALKSINNKRFVGFIPSKFKEEYLPKLTQSTTEISSYSSFDDLTVLRGEAATKKAFLESYDDLSIVHISTHGGVENGIPWLGFYDEKLQLDELYFTPTQKEMVVLSACKTAAGTNLKGEGIFNLTRGFIKAGAKSVVSTLWDVNEKANEEVVSAFYKELSNGENKSAALRNAKRDYLKKHQNTSEASPYYWSGLLLIGDDQPLITDSNTRVYFLAVSLGAILLILFFLRKQSKNVSF